MKSVFFIILVCVSVGNVFANWAWSNGDDPYNNGGVISKIFVGEENGITRLTFKYADPTYTGWYVYKCSGTLDENGKTFLMLLSAAKISGQKVNVDYDVINNEAIFSQVLLIEDE